MFVCVFVCVYVRTFGCDQDVTEEISVYPALGIVLYISRLLNKSFANAFFFERQLSKLREDVAEI